MFGERGVNYETVKNVFEKALEVPSKERKQFVVEHCKGEDILEEVLSLLSCSLPEDATDFSYEPMIGKKVGEYTITKRIGSGGMGRVYEAKNEKTGKCVAIKVMRKQFLGSSAGKRFEQEIRVLGSLNVPGVALIESAGTVEVEGVKLPWIAMELLEGSVSITEYAKDKTTEEKLGLLYKVCKTVDEAHRHGVIHRDLKPSNILVNTHGEPTIIDFGIAKVLDDELRATGLHTQASGFLGTPQYMAPEQFNQAKSETTATDVFSLGVISFEVITGEHPFASGDKSLPATMLAIMQEEPATIESINPEFRGDLSVVVQKAIAKDPRKRYVSANELATDLQHLIEGEPVSAKPEPLLSKLVRKHRFAAALLAITIPLLAIATTVSVYYAISANKQLVRNEKLLEFATGALKVQRDIVSQHPEFWKMHVGVSKSIADEVASDDPLLLIEMYELLGKQSVNSLGEHLFSEAAEVSRETLGANHPKTLILEAKFIGGDADGANLETVQKAQSVLARYDVGLPKEHAELLKVVSFTELTSSDAGVRKRGHEHANQAMQIAREELDGDAQLINSLAGRRAWSLVFKNGSEEAATEAIQIEEETVLPLLEEKYPQEDFRVLKAKIMLGVAYLQRSGHRTGDDQLEDIESALAINEFVVDSLIEQSGDNYNFVWQVMNNLAIALASKASWIEENSDSEHALEETSALRLRASSIWWKILRKQYFTRPVNTPMGSWYLLTFQQHLPKLAPTDEEWAQWADEVDLLIEK